MAGFAVNPDEVDDELGTALGLRADGKNPYPGMTYVDGVVDALNWVMEGEEKPFEELTE